jgi:hypothetical protein
VNNATTADLTRLAQDAVDAGNFAGATAFKDVFISFGGNADEWTVVIPANVAEAMEAAKAAKEAQYREALSARTAEQVVALIAWAKSVQASARFDAGAGAQARKDGLDEAGFRARYPEASEAQVKCFVAWNVIKTYQAAQRHFGLDVVGANNEAAAETLLAQAAEFGL